MGLLQSVIIQHEGLRLKPYKDTVGKLTIGVGRNLDDCGISHDEALVLLENDLNSCRYQLTQYSWFRTLDAVRQDVIVELVFNVGLQRALNFKKMIAALAEFDYATASKELLDSAWSKQVGPNRSNDMAKRLETGAYNVG
jgi:lysozyme